MPCWGEPQAGSILAPVVERIGIHAIVVVVAVVDPARVSAIKASMNASTVMFCEIRRRALVRGGIDPAADARKTAIGAAAESDAGMAEPAAEMPHSAADPAAAA